MVERPAQYVYDYVHDPRNLPEWASGLGRSVKLEDGRWVAEAAFGWVVVAFVERNDFGVLDHDVTLPSGEVIRNPLRVIADGATRCDVVFTFRRQPHAGDEEFERDIAAVTGDLHTLKRVMEA